MGPRHRRGKRRLTRRITLTLPHASLSAAQRIARGRNVNLSTVVAEALADGLRQHSAARRTEQILRSYERAFAGFSEQERLVLDGVLLSTS